MQWISKFVQKFLPKFIRREIIEMTNVTINRGTVQCGNAIAVFALDFFRVYHNQCWELFLQLVEERQRPFIFRALRVLIITLTLTIGLSEDDMVTDT